MRGGGGVGGGKDNLKKEIEGKKSRRRNVALSELKFICLNKGDKANAMAWTASEREYFFRAKF